MSDLTCAGCGRPTRKARTPPSVAPGTVAVVAAGKCATCYNLTRDTPRPPRVVKETRPSVESIEAGLAQWLQARRQRLVKQYLR